MGRNVERDNTRETFMNADRKTAILAGVFYFLGLIAGVLSVVPVIDLPDYLAQISLNSEQVITGAFFQFKNISKRVRQKPRIFKPSASCCEPAAIW